MTPSTPLNGFRSFVQFESLTRRVAGILQDYPDGTQIARELLQNSEDARSRVQWYLLDHQHHTTDNLILPEMHEYQGPALLAGNDSLFEEDDFKSLRSLADSGKKDDPLKVGMMGIGFNRYVVCLARILPCIAPASTSLLFFYVCDRSKSGGH
jgi:hypothetical protein